MPATTATAYADEPDPVQPQRADPSTSAPVAVPDAHLDRLQELLRLETARDDGRLQRRGRRRRQQARQRLQQRIRQGAVDCYHHLRDQGRTLEQCGQLLNLSPRTLRQWDRDCRRETIALVPVGRPT